MLPTPDLAKVTVVPATATPAGFFAVNTMVAGVVPSSGKLVPVDGFADIVDPVICMGSCIVAAPDVTVTVAVRLMPEAPAEKLALAIPVASVVPVLALNCPVEAEKVTACPVKTEFPASSAVAVMVMESEPSLLSVFALALKVSDVVVATTGGVTTGVLAAGVVPAAGTSRPPQPARASTSALTNKSCVRLRWVICTETSDNISPLGRDIAKRN